VSAAVTYVVPDLARPTRADKALAAAFPEHSRTAFHRAFDAGLVARRGSLIGRDSSVAPGDPIDFSFPDTAPSELRAVKIRLDVLFEDKWLIAINKKAGMVVHPGAGTGEDTLVHALLAHCKGSLSGIGGVERPGIVHRLDRETSGVIIVAKTDAAHTALAVQFAERTATKEYCALVAGVPRLLSGSATKSIGRNPRHRYKMAAFDEGHGGRPSRTDWTVAESFGGAAALVSCELHSGRTHQIRVHMASLGHPILGDSIYGWRPDSSMKAQPGRVMLHAARLVVAHPKTGKRLELKAPIPADFKAMIRALRGA
jgi:23S rRNA pseudouridine1911/1915/1917 synthase